MRNHRIQQFSPAGQLIRTWQTPIFPSWWYTDPNWSPFLVRLATDADGNVFMVDGTMRLSRYTPSGRMQGQRRIGLRRSDVGPDGYPQPYASLALAIGREGTIDLSLEARGPDNKGGAPEYLYLQQRDRRGTIRQEWTDLDQAFPEGRPLVATGIAVTSKGSLWITDGAEHGLIELSRRGAPLRRVGAEGCGPGRFEEPSGVAVDGNDRVYVVDRGSRTLQELSPTGQPLAFW